MRPQTLTILSHLKAGKSINARWCSYHLGIDRLAAHINDLRDHGYKIDTVLHRNANNTGSYAEYVPIKMTLDNAVSDEGKG